MGSDCKAWSIAQVTQAIATLAVVFCDIALEKHKKFSLFDGSFASSFYLGKPASSLTRHLMFNATPRDPRRDFADFANRAGHGDHSGLRVGSLLVSVDDTCWCVLYALPHLSRLPTDNAASKLQ